MKTVSGRNFRLKLGNRVTVIRLGRWTFVFSQGRILGVNLLSFSLARSP